MSSETGKVWEIFPNFSHQVTSTLEVRNSGASLSDLFGYSKEFEHQLQLQMQPDDDFKITSLLYESEYVNSDNFHPPPMTMNPTDRRIQWTHELQERFTRAIEWLGGPAKATPSNILYLMRVTGLTLDHIKSHLQTCRKNLDRDSTKISKSAGDVFANLDSESPRKSTTSASLALDTEGPSKQRTTNKRSKGKKKVGKDTPDKKMRYEEIQKLQEVENRDMDVLREFYGHTLRNFEQVSDVGAIPTFSNNLLDAYNSCSSNLIQQQPPVTDGSVVEGCWLNSNVLQQF
ncbi:Homeodomain-like superfamily protein [Euphorbia peplus]|nr:Homeodomain-like superfamily protein [Euphorbia peplus]